MRTATYRWVVGVLGVMVLGGVAGAQSAEPACTVGVQSYSVYSAGGTHGGPYTATAKQSFEQRLPDGSYVRGSVRTHQARDSAGKTMSESERGCQRDENGVPQPKFGVGVIDQTKRVSISWEIGVGADDVVRIFHMGDPPKPLTAEELAAQRKRFAQQQPPRYSSKREDLGMRTIAGVDAHGSRVTQTIPAGAEGNELPLVIVSETWNSKELGLILLGMRDDPRRGKTTFEIEELTQGEPDPTLFVPPAGYKIVDQNPPVDNATKP
ncbi:hypothetical protein [Granulicella sp. L46]|jgi:hypothetical protein|uniref:hypothetical protein n=1 Tax=Granulicella sp. L46 TaxID=1641865 RepID=UPI00131C25AC|nr:hypothetical protein [Granulicella sp. L46]